MERWGGPAAQAWVDAQELLEGILAPFAELLAEPLRPGSGTRVLDAGCTVGGEGPALGSRR